MDESRLWVKGLKHKQNGQTEYAVSRPLRGRQERFEAVTAPFPVAEGRKRHRPFVISVSPKQFLHFGIVALEQKGRVMCMEMGARPCQNRYVFGQRNGNMHKRIDRRTA